MPRSMVLLQLSPNRYGVRIADDLGHGRSAAPEGLTPRCLGSKTSTGFVNDSAAKWRARTRSS